MKDVVGLGVILLDEQMFVDSVPGEDQKEKATHFRRQIGGPVPTALAMVRRFGFSCHFIGPWGNDFAGDLIEQDLNSEAISWSQRCRHDGRLTGIAHVWTSNRNGSRTIVAKPCGWDGFQLSESDIHHLKTCRALHLDGTGDTLALQAASIVHGSGGMVCVDAGSPKDATLRLIPLATVFSFPERFARQFFGHSDIAAAGKQILHQGAQMVVCTRGAKGCVLFEGDTITEVPAFSVNAVDSTGAGDVFCGGLIGSLLGGHPNRHAVHTGSAAAALKCRSIGNRDALPGIEQIRELLASKTQNN